MTYNYVIWTEGVSEINYWIELNIGSYREIAIAIESEAGDSLTYVDPVYRSKRIFA